MTVALFWFWLGGFAAVSSIGLVTTPHVAREWRTWLVWLAWPVFHTWAASLARWRILSAASRVIDDAIDAETKRIDEEGDS
jgi:hypothetical protein